MHSCFCTIITPDYWPYALALYDSLAALDPQIQLAVLVSQDSKGKDDYSIFQNNRNIQVYKIKDLEHISIAKEIRSKYHENYHDAYRWSMKPVFMNFLFQKGYDKVIYVDSDIYFFNDFTFLFDELEHCNLLLSPHWRSSDPEADLANFKLNFLDGIYNGGFIGATPAAETALNYWAKLCLFNCEINRSEGFYVDQRYLDILPSRFEGVKSIRHKGCNVAYWNRVDCSRTINKEGKVMIDNKFPVIFIHFTYSLFLGVFFEDDKILLPFLEKYRDNILKYSEKNILSEFYKK
ncbi:MAG: glycosyltransferase [Christiangramia sp.]|uniref:glycosyltransferase n=1 Tax=Christiangramia sp. TaxID=1931228 RepID=UPI0032420D24